MYILGTHGIYPVMYAYLVPHGLAFRTLIGDCTLYSHALIGEYIPLYLWHSLRWAWLMIIRYVSYVNLHQKKKCQKQSYGSARNLRWLSFQ